MIVLLAKYWDNIENYEYYFFCHLGINRNKRFLRLLIKNFLLENFNDSYCSKNTLFPNSIFLIFQVFFNFSRIRKDIF